MPIGKIEAFDETNDDWNPCVERVEQYCIANEIKEEKQVAVMLSHGNCGERYFRVAGHYKTQGSALFGRDCLHEIKLDWKRIYAISKEKPPPCTQNKLDKILDEYSKVF